MIDPSGWTSWAVRSSTEPATTSLPKPPDSLGHTIASIETPRIAENAPKVAVIARLKNCRRVTPSPLATPSSRSSSTTGAAPPRPVAAPPAPAPARGAASSASATPPGRARGHQGQRAIGAIGGDRLPAHGAPPCLLGVLRPTAGGDGKGPDGGRDAHDGNGDQENLERRHLERDPILEVVEEDAVGPRIGEVEPLSTEEDSEEGEDRSPGEEEGEHQDGELAIGRLGRWVPVEVGDRHQPYETKRRHQYPGHLGIEVGEQLLESEEVPGRFRRVGRLVEVGRLQQRRLEDDREHHQEPGHRQQAGELGDHQVGPGVDLVGRLGLDLLDRLCLDHGEEPLGAHSFGTPVGAATGR